MKVQAPEDKGKEALVSGGVGWMDRGWASGFVGKSSGWVSDLNVGLTPVKS